MYLAEQFYKKILKKEPLYYAGSLVNKNISAGVIGVDVPVVIKEKNE